MANKLFNEICLNKDEAFIISESTLPGIYELVAERTGQYAPVSEFIDIPYGGNMPDPSEKGKGWRIITKEKEDLFGRLYTFEEVLKIDSLLKQSGSKWRVPTKDDWDSLLNGIEINPAYKNHSVLGNVECGLDAGKFLKSTDKIWRPSVFSGSDKYNFRILPTGYSDFRAKLLLEYDSNKDVEGYRNCAAFWTVTPAEILKNGDFGMIYAKFFSYKKRSVMQGIVPKEARLSLRLVSDYTIENNKYEEIFGNTYETGLIISPDNTYVKVWTLRNLDTTMGSKDFGYVSKEWENNPSDLRRINDIYYINEWKGDFWTKKRLHEGDSVVIVNGPNNVYNHEWRLCYNNGEYIMADIEHGLDLTNVKETTITF